MSEMGLLMSPPQMNHLYGVVIGIVTNNQDPDKLGRVKVKLPWLSEEDESPWARILTPMAGKEMGIYCLPEVNDEVLVAFEHGQVAFPYVLGMLWNGKKKPPNDNQDGKNNQRLIKSRSGHTIVLDDDEQDAKMLIKSRSGHTIVFDDDEQDAKISIQDGGGKNRIVLSTADNAIYITSDAEIVLKANNRKLTLSAKEIDIQSQTDIKLEAKGNYALNATNCEIKATAQAKLEASAGMELTCMAGVNVNNGALEIQ